MDRRIAAILAADARLGRVALAAHLEGLMNGTFLIALGGVWPWTISRSLMIEGQLPLDAQPSLPDHLTHPPMGPLRLAIQIRQCGLNAPRALQRWIAVMISAAIAHKPSALLP